MFWHPLQQFLCLGSGDLYPFAWFHVNSCILHSDPALCLSYCISRGAAQALADLCLPHLCCPSFLYSNYWFDYGAPLWEASLSCDSCSHGKHLHYLPTPDEPHHLQCEDPTDPWQDKEVVHHVEEVKHFELKRSELFRCRKLWAGRGKEYLFKLCIK